MALASRGLRDIGDGLESMDEMEAEVVRRQARRIQVQSLLVGLAASAITWLVT